MATKDVVLPHRFESCEVSKRVSPQLGEDADTHALAALDAWKHCEYMCRNYVLSGLANELYNVYCKMTTAKELWESLERKYKTEDAGTKKFVVAQFLDFKMVDSKTAMSQVEELQISIADILLEGIALGEAFQVATMIENLPPSCVVFKNYLKLKQKAMNMEDLVVCLRIEEDNRAKLNGSQVDIYAKANMIEHAQSSKRYKGKPKGNGKAKFNLGPRKGGVKKKVAVFKGKCYNCGESGHRAGECSKPKKEKANMIDEDENLVAIISDLTAMMKEVNVISDHSKGWWVDTGATRHVC
ncbi:uncharacterized protein LOC143635645 [Bidens hawaiensis]|uniref:uncharacterized protein LOC143635645 n=1 Tax=Bidens hawaiensis TaxID=980011 RepID=UPI00404B951A